MEDKEKRTKRFQQKKRHIERQSKIYDETMGKYDIPISSRYLKGKDSGKSKHRFHKKKSLNCGDPKCFMCMNPRKAFGQKTIQEIKFEAAGVDYD